MSFFISRFRGLGIALAVLAISAGAVFAAAPSMAPVSSHAAGQALTDDPGDSASPSESASPTDSASPSASESPSASPSESPEPTESLEPTESPEPSAATEGAASPRPDTHGALVSTAARMPTPSGFPNHGAFVSCVAHMHVSAAGFDWSTVTPESCGIVPAGSAQPQSTTHGQGASHAAAGKANGKGHNNSKHGG